MDKYLRKQNYHHEHDRLQSVCSLENNDTINILKIVFYIQCWRSLLTYIEVRCKILNDSKIYMCQINMLKIQSLRQLWLFYSLRYLNCHCIIVSCCFHDFYLFLLFFFFQSSPSLRRVQSKDRKLILHYNLNKVCLKRRCLNAFFRGISKKQKDEI